VTSTVITGISSLTTNDPAHDRGRSGILEDAWIVVDDVSGLVIDVGTGPAPEADERRDVGGRAVIPGFVDSHTHLVFGGDRSAEFAARMAGAPYAAGGIATTVAATTAATTDDLTCRTRELWQRARRGGTTTVEIKSGYALDAAGEERLLQIAGDVTEERTYLGAHVVPVSYAGRTDDYVHLVCGEMLRRCAPHARWIDAFCEVGAFDADQCRAVLEAGAAAGLGGRLHANQLGPGPGVQLAVEMGCASADHCTYLTDDDIAALASGTTVATFLPATDFSTRQPYPDARRAIDAGVTVALASNCNPGSSFTTSMSFVIALAVRDLRMTIDEAIWAATAGGAAALRRTDVGRLAPGSRADVVVLDAPAPIHLVYRPGEPLIDTVVVAGSPATSSPSGRVP
jgi:imidazolonepropionase